MFSIKYVTCAVMVTCIVLLHGTCASLILNKTTNLHRNLLSNYASHIRPCLDCVGPLQVNLTFYLASLNGLDELQGEMSTAGLLMVEWYDERITWDPKDYAGVQSLLFSTDKVWIPPIIGGNPSLKASNLHTDVHFVRYLFYGYAVWLPGDVFRTTCDYDIYNYPFDKQTCDILFLPRAYLDNEIVLKTPEEHIDTPLYTDNGEWTLTDTSTNSTSINDVPMAKFSFTFKRRSEFFFVNVILPIILLSFLNCLVYLIPTESGEQISYSITVLLSFAVFMTLVNDNIPKSSAPMPILCYYLISTFIGSVFIMASTILSINIFHRDSKSHISSFYKAVVCFANPCNKVVSRENKSIHNQTYYRKQSGDNVYGHNTNRSGHIDDDDTINTENAKTLQWKEVAAAVDKLSFLLFVIYFMAVQSCLVVALMMV